MTMMMVMIDINFSLDGAGILWCLYVFELVFASSSSSQTQKASSAWRHAFAYLMA